MLPIRLGYLATITTIGLVCAFAPQLFFITAENFAPLKLFLALGGFIGIFWLLHEADGAKRRERSGA